MVNARRCRQEGESMRVRGLVSSLLKKMLEETTFIALQTALCPPLLFQSAFWQLLQQYPKIRHCAQTRSGLLCSPQNLQAFMAFDDFPKLKTIWGTI